MAKELKTASAEDVVNAKADLAAMIDRIERLEEDKKGIADDIKDLYAEAKGKGYDAKTLRKIIRLRKQSAERRAEEDQLLELYKAALGME